MARMPSKPTKRPSHMRAKRDLPPARLTELRKRLGLGAMSFDLLKEMIFETTDPPTEGKSVPRSSGSECIWLTVKHRDGDKDVCICMTYLEAASEQQDRRMAA